MEDDGVAELFMREVKLEILQEGNFIKDFLEDSFWKIQACSFFPLKLVSSIV